MSERLSPQREAVTEPFRDDVRELLEKSGWNETAEDCVVAKNGTLWTETNLALDSGIDAPDKSWSVAFDSSVPAAVIVASALAASGIDVASLVAERDEARARLRELESELAEHTEPDADPGRCLDVHAFSPRDGWRMICGSCDHGKNAPCHREGATS